MFIKILKLLIVNVFIIYIIFYIIYSFIRTKLNINILFIY